MQSTNLETLNTRSKIVLELEGQLRIDEPDPTKGNQVRSADVRAKSTLDYFEKIAFAKPVAETSADQQQAAVASARRYIEAGMENWISGSASSYQLRPECSQTRQLIYEGKWQQYCEDHTLDLQDVELLHSPINTACLELLLPTEPAKPDDQWKISSQAAKSVFNLDAVHTSTLVAKISKVEQGVATIELSGELEATANNVPTHLKVTGNFHAKLASQCALISWIGLSVQEEREISAVEPGFAVTARIRIIRDEQEDRQLTVSGDALRSLTTAEDPGRWLVRLQSMAGRYSMLADRRWRFYLDNGEEAILRMIENNTVIAQCNITRPSRMESGKQLTLEGFQADVRAGLKDSFGSFLESNEKLTSSQLRLIRTVVLGEREEVPIQWVYNHLSDDSGRRVVMVFTMGGNVTDRFAGADEQMSSSFELLPEASEGGGSPQAAPQLSAGRSSADSQSILDR
jgi:hypothetical protein